MVFYFTTVGTHDFIFFSFFLFFFSFFDFVLFTMRLSDPEYIVYMGRDKFENEDLIRYGWPEDVWCVFLISHL
jgi:hypothetical protein